MPHEPMRNPATIKVGADLGPLSIECEALVGPDAIDDYLDRMRAAIDRQRAQYQIDLSTQELVAALDRVAQIPDEKAGYSKKRQEERTKLVKELQIRYELRQTNKRSPRPFSLADVRQDTEKFDAETAEGHARFDADLEKNKQLIGFAEKQIERQKAIIAGASKAEALLRHSNSGAAAALAAAE